MKTILFACALFVCSLISAQKVKTDMVPMICTYLPKYSIPAEQQTFSCVTLECEANQQLRSMTSMENTNWNLATNKIISGFRNVGAGQNPTIAVTIRTEPFSIVSKTVAMGTTTGANNAQVPGYSYDLKANYTLSAVVVKNGDTVATIVRNQGAFTQVNFPNTVKPMTSPAAFTSNTALDAEYKKNNDIQAVVRKKHNEDYIAFLTDTLNVLFGYASNRMYFELATAKGKSYDYKDLDSAMDYIKAAMDSVTAHTKANRNHNWSFASSRQLVQKAVDIWERALKEESTDSKARIHPELAGHIRLNLALGYMMLDNYTKAAELYNRCYADPELSNGTKRNIDFILKTMYPRFKSGYETHKASLE